MHLNVSRRHLPAAYDAGCGVTSQMQLCQCLVAGVRQRDYPRGI
jgi:hypothetical protein